MSVIKGTKTVSRPLFDSKGLQSIHIVSKEKLVEEIPYKGSPLGRRPPFSHSLF